MANAARTAGEAGEWAAGAAFPQLLPAPSPMAMPAQSLEDGGRASDTVLSEPGLAWRRTVLFSATGLLTALGAGIMSALLSLNGFTAIDAAALAIFTILFAWIAFSGASGVAGFIISLNESRDKGPLPAIRTRTALLMPTYNEDPSRVLAGVQAMHDDLVAKGVSGCFDIFVLSDTRHDDIARDEMLGVLRLIRRSQGAGGIYYRRREQNTDRKAGNIGQWVQTFGGAYESMIILDADSLMTADTIVRLTASMERDEKVGLVQTLPLVVRADTLFGRLQQFAGRVYGPMIARGQDWWSGAEGNYWGHNAIIRTRAFAECAGLPHLKGAKPFGGHILSHDFVEAALLRRGGWAVRMDASLTGSFEETPPTLLDMAARDRRWCQGNLQHAALLGAAGLHWISRLHLFRGVLSYLTAPLWLAFLIVGPLVWREQRHAVDAAGAAPLVGWLLAATVALLLGPKLLAGVLILRDGAKAIGGRRRFALSLVAEMALSALFAPIVMLMHSRAVYEVLSGKDSGWNAQQRDGAEFTLAQAWRAHRGHMLAGVICGLAAYAFDAAFFWWTLPVTLGLVLAAPLSALSARVSLGRAARRLGLLVTPEEARAPTVVRRATLLRVVNGLEDTSVGASERPAKEALAA